MKFNSLSEQENVRNDQEKIIALWIGYSFCHRNM